MRLWLALLFVCAPAWGATRDPLDAGAGPSLPSLGEVKRIRRHGHRRTTRPPPIEPVVVQPQVAPGMAASQPASQPAPQEEAQEELVSPFEVQEPELATPTKADRFQTSGWLRSQVALGFANGYRSGRPDILALPYDKLVQRDQVLLRLQYARGDYFEAVAEGLLSFSLFEQDPSNPSRAFNGFNGPSRIEFVPELRQTYVGFFVGRFDFRFGQQRLAWGKGDLFAPNDVLNAKDLRDPLLAEPDLLRVPTLMVRTDIDLTIASLQLAYVPFYTPDRSETYGTNWSLWQPTLAAPYLALLNYETRFTNPSVAGPALASFRQPTTVAPNFADGQLGARLLASAGSFDLGINYHWGFDSTPRLQLDPALIRSLFAVANYAKATSAQLTQAFGANPIPAADYVFARRHHAGVEIATVAGPMAFRLDAAFETNRGFADDYLNVNARSTVQTVLSIEYQTGKFADAVLLEISYLRVLGVQLPPSLFVEMNNLGAAAVARWMFFDHLILDLRAIVGVLPQTYMLRPQIGVKFGELQIMAGVVLMGGQPYSQFAYFQRNQAAYLTVKYQF